MNVLQPNEAGHWQPNKLIVSFWNIFCCHSINLCLYVSNKWFYTKFYCFFSSRRNFCTLAIKCDTIKSTKKWFNPYNSCYKLWKCLKSSQDISLFCLNLCAKFHYCMIMKISIKIRCAIKHATLFTFCLLWSINWN